MTDASISQTRRYQWRVNQFDPEDPDAVRDAALFAAERADFGGVKINILQFARAQIA